MQTKINASGILEIQDSEHKRLLNRFVYVCFDLFYLKTVDFDNCLVFIAVATN